MEEAYFSGLEVGLQLGQKYGELHYKIVALMAKFSSVNKHSTLYSAWNEMINVFEEIEELTDDSEREDRRDALKCMIAEFHAAKKRLGEELRELRRLQKAKDVAAAIKAAKPRRKQVRNQKRKASQAELVCDEVRPRAKEPLMCVEVPPQNSDTDEEEPPNKATKEDGE